MNNNLPVVILAGGLGTRLREETETKPKPMVEIGDMPIVWHIMKHYATFGFSEFVLCLGYKGHHIKNFFLGHQARRGSLSLDLKSGAIDVHQAEGHDDWVVHLLDTGDKTMTGGRIKRAAEFLGDRPFMATYGDGVTDLNISDLLRLHREENRRASVTAVRPPARFGGLKLEGNRVAEFAEKRHLDEGWINGGFMVFEPGIAARIAGDDTVLEREPLEGLAADGELTAFHHDGFWQCMDTVRDLTLLRELWEGGRAPWKSW